MAATLPIPVPGIRVGQAVDSLVASGVTVILPDRPAVASMHVAGGSPGTRESDLLRPEQAVQRVDALVLAGGSAFGLDAATGVQAWLREHGRGFPVAANAVAANAVAANAVAANAGGAQLRVPIVPAAILFDLNNGGDKDWGRYPPYRELGYRATANAATEVVTGRAGAGYGATTATTPGGLGMASQRLTGAGVTFTAIMAINAAGSPLMGSSRHFWAAPFEQGTEFGGLGLPADLPDDLTQVRTKAGHSTAGMNTTIGVVLTDARISKLEAKQIAVMAHDGFARALYPVHSPGDGDLLYVLSTGAVDLPRSELSLLTLGTAAANVVTRAIAQGVYAAMQDDGKDEGQDKTQDLRQDQS